MSNLNQKIYYARLIGAPYPKINCIAGCCATFTFEGFNTMSKLEFSESIEYIKNKAMKNAGHLITCIICQQQYLQWHKHFLKEGFKLSFKYKNAEYKKHQNTIFVYTLLTTKNLK